MNNCGSISLVGFDYIIEYDLTSSECVKLRFDGREIYFTLSLPANLYTNTERTLNHLYRLSFPVKLFKNQEELTPQMEELHTLYQFFMGDKYSPEFAAAYCNAYCRQRDDIVLE